MKICQIVILFILNSSLFYSSVGFAEEAPFVCQIGKYVILPNETTGVDAKNPEHMYATVSKTKNKLLLRDYEPESLMPFDRDLIVPVIRDYLVRVNEWTYLRLDAQIYLTRMLLDARAHGEYIINVLWVQILAFSVPSFFN